MIEVGHVQEQAKKYITSQDEQSCVELMVMVALQTVATRGTLEGCLYMEVRLGCCLNCCSLMHLQVTPMLQSEALSCTKSLLSLDHPAAPLRYQLAFRFIQQHFSAPALQAADRPVLCNTMVGIVVMMHMHVLHYLHM